MEKVKLIWAFVAIGTVVSSRCYGQWAITYGGPAEHKGQSIQQTTDGGYILGGESYLSARDRDMWVLKLNSDGSIAWQKSYFQPSVFDHSKLFRRGYIQQTLDGGYVVAGTFSVGSPAQTDIWVLKLTSDGIIAWQKAYDTRYYDYVNSIQQTTDGGYVLGGEGGGSGGFILILKLKSDGTIAWQKTYGIASPYFINAWVASVQQTSDGGYIVGAKQRYPSALLGDIWLLKLNSDGTIAWQRMYGPAWPRGDPPYSVPIQQTTDGGYIVGLATPLFGAAGKDFLILKLRADGTIAWQKRYGGSYDEYAISIQQTRDGGYIVAGNTYSFGALESDILILKLDPHGTIAWQTRFGDQHREYARCIRETFDQEGNPDGYIIAGDTYSFGVGAIEWEEEYYRCSDFLVLRLNEDGEIPGCGHIGNSDVVVSDTWLKEFQDAPVVVQDTPGYSYDTSISPKDTLAVTSEVCVLHGYDITDLENKALRYEDKLQQSHLIEGQLLSRKHDGTFDEHGDSAIWTGLYVASEAYRYGHSGDETAYSNMKNGLQALHKLQVATGQPGLVGRFVYPDGSCWAGSRTFTSKDAYTGVMFGYAVAYPFIREPELRQMVEDDVSAIGNHFVDHGLCFVGAEPYKVVVDLKPNVTKEHLLYLVDLIDDESLQGTVAEVARIRAQVLELDEKIRNKEIFGWEPHLDLEEALLWVGLILEPPLGPLVLDVRDLVKPICEAETAEEKDIQFFIEELALCSNKADLRTLLENTWDGGFRHTLPRVLKMLRDMPPGLLALWLGLKYGDPASEDLWALLDDLEDDVLVEIVEYLKVFMLGGTVSRPFPCYAFDCRVQTLNTYLSQLPYPISKPEDVKVLASNALLALHILKAAAYITGDAKIKQSYDTHKNELIDIASKWGPAIDVMLSCCLGYDALNAFRIQGPHHLEWLALHNLIQLENDADTKRAYRQLMYQSYWWDRFDLNIFANFIYAINADYYSQSPLCRIESLGPFPDYGPMDVDYTDESLTNKPFGGKIEFFGSEGTRFPIPLDKRPRDFFIWQRSPRRLSAGEATGKIFPGLDYLLPYWMGRYYKLFGERPSPSPSSPHRSPSPSPPSPPSPPPSLPDSDSDGIPDELELITGTEPHNSDTDNDGLLDGRGSGEDINANGVVDPGETDPRRLDSDGDGIQDGTEKGLTEPEGLDTDMSVFIPDADPSSRTEPLTPDTDGDGLLDGQEDVNKNGAVDIGETSPVLADTDGDGYGDWEEIKAGSDPTNPDNYGQPKGDFCGENFGPPDGYVDVWDLMQFADQWHTSTGDSNWDSKFDLTGPNFGNLDGYVDVWDLMVFADHWHKGQKP